MKAKVLDIFRSIQGEGKYAGIVQVFVRFFECNMHCVWCDTPNSIGDTTRNYTEISKEQMMEQIKLLWKKDHSLSLTGGEPLLHKDFIKSMLPLLKKENILSYLETNGTLPQELNEIIDGIDIIAMDLKLQSSTKTREYWDEHEEFLKIASKKDVFVKIVISSQTIKEDVKKAVDLVASLDKNLLFILQPNYFDMNNGVVQKCVDFQEDCRKVLKNVRIIPQMHKMMRVK